MIVVKKNPKSDRHKPARMIRVRDQIAQQFDILASRNNTDVTEEVNRAARELLVREGLWPPGKSDAAEDDD